MQLINSATVSVPGRLVCRGGGLRRIPITVRFGIVRRPDERLCLVDTGYGKAVTSGDRSLALRLYNRILRPRLIEGNSPKEIVASLGANPTDVATVVLTHFHADHVACLKDFPHARILAHSGAAKTVLGMGQAQAIHNGIFKELLPADMTDRIDPIELCPVQQAHPSLGSGFDIFGDGSYIAIALPGHADGHFGLYWDSGQGPMLYATDAAWTLKALSEDRTPELPRRAVFHDRHVARATEKRLRNFIAAGGTVVLCHDQEMVP